MTVAGDEAEEERLRASVARLRAAGAPVIYLEPEKTNDRLHATGLHGGLYTTTGAVVNPLRLVRHLAEVSEADIHEHLPVRSVRWNVKDGVLLDTPDVRLWAERVVLAVGPSLPSLVPSLSPWVRPVRAQMLATAPAETPTIPMPVYSHRGGFYVRQRDEGHVLVGGGRHQHREAEETAADSTTPAVQATIERYLHTHFPWTTELSIEHRWSGTMGFSPDGRPVVGPIPEHSASVFATGFTGHGMGYGFRMGRLLARSVCGKTQPEDYDLFSVSRFNEEETSQNLESTSTGPSPQS
jgi:glycine/D-amino acid oxidase-like deaminating enzyme